MARKPGNRKGDERTLEEDGPFRVSGPPGESLERKFGRFTDIRTIATGGMGEILRAFDPVIGRPVAIKVILSGEAARGEEISRFMREAQITGQLVHPNIPPIHEMGQTRDGRLYFVMKLIDGKSLTGCLDDLDRRSNPERLLAARREHLAALVKVCDALGYAHAQGVVHRDLKPDNIMIGTFGEVLVMDWGISKILTEREGSPKGTVDPSVHIGGTMMGDVLGTPAYMAPEQARGRVDEIDPRTDIYSLGVVLYEVLTHRLPFEGRTVQETITRVMKGRYTLPSRRRTRIRVPVELDAVVARAMAHDRRDRYRDVSEFASEIERHLAGETLEAASYTTWQRFVKWVSRHRAVSAVSAISSVLIIVFILGLIGALLRARDAERSRADEARMAREAEEIASESRIAAENALAEIGDAGVLKGLLEERNAAWGGYPDHPEVMERWIHQARDLLSRKEAHRNAKIRLENERRGATGEHGDRIDWQLAHRHEILEGLDEIERTVEEMGAKIASIEGLQRRMMTLAAEPITWQETIRRIQESDRYGGLRVKEMIGLVPLGPDPRSGLWEFWHIESGERPVRIDGEVSMAPETGIVLVLLPAGSFMMGSVRGSRHAQPDESPRHRVKMRPFLISKYELTQAQWQRLSGENPSFFNETSHRGYVNATHPVEMVGWNDCMEQLPRVGLCLPTEAQWEYAARGGRQTSWYTGDDPSGLVDHANLADQSFVTKLAGVNRGEDWDDGFPLHAPVGRFLPNPFGLHDVTGNLHEWCLDTYNEGYEGAPDDGSMWFQENTPGRVYRGGSWTNLALTCRLTNRAWGSRSYRSRNLGIRPVRGIHSD